MCNFTARILQADGWEEITDVTQISHTDTGLRLETLFGASNVLDGYRITLLDLLKGVIHLEPVEAT